MLLWMAGFALGAPQVEVVKIPMGSFLMGSDEEGTFGDEKPVHKAVLTHDFYMMKYEVTQEFYMELVPENPSKFKECGSDCPVEMVSWTDAAQFANALSRSHGMEECYSIGLGQTIWEKGYGCSGWRLPTEAEWEYAAKAGSDTLYAGSNNISEVSWYGEDPKEGTTHPVGGKAPNAWGLYDMSGNVWEWCWDWKGRYSRGGRTNPRGPMHGEFRVRRGGSWFYGEEGSKVAFRYSGLPDSREPATGFRLVRTSN